MDLKGGRTDSLLLHHHRQTSHEPYQEFLATRTISQKAPSFLTPEHNKITVPTYLMSSTERVHDEENVISNRSTRSISAPPVAEHVRTLFFVFLNPFHSKLGRYCSISHVRARFSGPTKASRLLLLLCTEVS